MGLGILRRWKQRRITVNGWASEYRIILQSWHLSQKTTKNRLTCQRHLCDQIGSMQLRDVRASDIAQAVNALAESGRRVTARRMLYEADSLFYQAIIAGVMDHNPATPLRPPSAPVSRSRLSWEHYLAIYQWSVDNGPDWYPCALRLALVSGQRRSDIVRMHDDHIVDEHLRVEQYKTGARIELPLALRLDAVDTTLGEVIDDCSGRGGYLLQKRNGTRYSEGYISTLFADACREALQGHDWGEKTPPTFHEIRSLSERLYRAQGIDTQTLLGHRRQSMTDEYNDDRGLSADAWKRVAL